MVLCVKNLTVSIEYTEHTYFDNYTPVLCLYYLGWSKEQEVQEGRATIAPKEKVICQVTILLVIS